MMGVSAPRPGDQGSNSSIWPPGEVNAGSLAPFALLGRLLAPFLPLALETPDFFLSVPRAPDDDPTGPMESLVEATAAASLEQVFEVVGAKTESPEPPWCNPLVSTAPPPPLSPQSSSSPRSSSSSSSSSNNSDKPFFLDFFGLVSFAFFAFCSRPLGARERTASKTPSRSPRKSKWPSSFVGKLSSGPRVIPCFCARNFSILRFMLEFQ
mmetsp:Transcript_86532/g.173143  ORF Transcript_86532/g.173143 Transcript_86532/m.173143 type:complete len:210 (-) Transcript_86532:1080-1709(-)